MQRVDQSYTGIRTRLTRRPGSPSRGGAALASLRRQAGALTLSLGILGIYFSFLFIFNEMGTLISKKQLKSKFLLEFEDQHGIYLQPQKPLVVDAMKAGPVLCRSRGRRCLCQRPQKPKARWLQGFRV